MKYVVTYGYSTTEFLSLSDAIAHAGTFGLGPDVVQTIDEPSQSISSEDVFDKGVVEGYNIPGTPYYLGLSEYDRGQFASMLLLVNQALDLGMITGSTPQMIHDKNGSPITLTTTQFQQVMVGYGFYYYTIWSNSYS